MNPYVGVALGAGVGEYHRQEANRRANEAEERAKTADARQAESHGLQMKSGKMQLETGQLNLDQARALDARRKEYAAAARGDRDALNGIIQRYNSNQGAFGDGMSVVPTSGERGDMAHFVDGKGQVVRSVPMTQETLTPLLSQAYLAEMQFDSPHAFTEQQKLGVERTKADAAKQQAVTMEKYRESQVSQPHLMQDGTGRIIALDASGTKVLGTYGSARPYGAYGMDDPRKTGFSAIALTPEGQTVYQKAGAIGLFTDDGQGNPVRYAGDVSKLKGVGGQPTQPRNYDAEGHRKALLELGPRPEAKRGWFGQDDKAGAQWDSRRNYVNEVYGAQGAPSAAPPIMQMPPPGSQPQRPGTAPTTQSAPSGRQLDVVSKSGLGYNVRMPDQSVRFMTWPEMQALGMSVQQLPTR